MKQVRAVGGNIELFFIEVNAILIIRVWVVDENNVSGKKVNELNFEEIESWKLVGARIFYRGISERIKSKSNARLCGDVNK